MCAPSASFGKYKQSGWPLVWRMTAARPTLESFPVVGEDEIGIQSNPPSLAETRQKALAFPTAWAKRQTMATAKAQFILQGAAQAAMAGRALVGCI